MDSGDATAALERFRALVDERFREQPSLGDFAAEKRQQAIVKLGAMGGDGETRNAIRRWHEEGEQAIRESGIPWTVVRPGRFMSNALHWAHSIKAEGVLRSSTGAAAAAVSALTGIAANHLYRALTHPRSGA